MEERIKARAIVKGSRGIAQFAYDHLEEIMNGCTVDFALNNPMEEMESIEDFKNECASWCGLAMTEVPKVFGSDRVVLCVCYYGSISFPFFAALDLAYELNDEVEIIAKAINEEADFEEGGEFKPDELVYVELVER